MKRTARCASRTIAATTTASPASCLLPPGASADLPGDEITLILRELDTVDPEEYTLTVADLRAATPLGESAWRIPALDWVLVFYRHVPIAHPTS